MQGTQTMSDPAVAPTIHGLLAEAARMLFEQHHYVECAEILELSCKHCNDADTLFSLYANARTCYFLSNNVPQALAKLEAQEQLGLEVDWTMTRDKANYLRYVNRHDEALQCAQRITDDATRDLALGWFLHKQDRIREAFLSTEKSRSKKFWFNKPINYDFVLWQGQPVENLVVITESGSGDQIIFARWIPQLRQLARNVYYDGNNTLADVFVRNFDIEYFPGNRHWGPHSLHGIPVMSLASVLDVDDVGPTEYLKPCARHLDIYRKGLPRTHARRIGLCCQGEPTHIETRLRTLPWTQIVDALHDLGEIINLQMNNRDRDHRVMFPKFNSWEDTLALIDTCDVVVTCDTSIAHAAGALGKTTIVLMHAAAYFTWNHNQDMARTKWYKDAWCIHQDYPCKWDEPISKCRELIKTLFNKDPNDT